MGKTRRTRNPSRRAVGTFHAAGRPIAFHFLYASRLAAFKILSVLLPSSFMHSPQISQGLICGRAICSIPPRTVTSLQSQHRYSFFSSTIMDPAIIFSFQLAILRLNVLVEVGTNLRCRFATTMVILDSPMRFRSSESCVKSRSFRLKLFALRSREKLTANSCFLAIFILLQCTSLRDVHFFVLIVEVSSFPLGSKFLLV